MTRLGRTARPVTFLGGAVGARCEGLLRRDDGLDPLVVPSAAETRVILTVRTERSPDQTAFFDPDPAVTAEESDDLLRHLETALDGGGVEGLTLSGSSPSTATHGLYRELIAAAHARKVPAFLDTYGPALDAVRGVWPDVVQLNRREATAYLKRPNPSDADFLGLIETWSRLGVAAAVITDGPKPAFAKVQGRVYRVTPPKIDAVNPIGSGDSLLAGLADGWLKALEPEALIRHAFGCASANALVWDAGAVDPDLAARQGEAVMVELL